jgi:hypothetical protein
MNRFNTKRALAASIMLLSVSLFSSETAFAQSLKQQLVGTWKVTSATMQIGDEVKPVPLGKDIVGMIMYNPDGYMCFAAMSASRAKFGSGDRLAGSVEQKAAAFDSYRNTCGRYEILSEPERVISHSFEVSLTPDVTGQSEKRFIKEISADRLVLQTVPHTAGGQQAVGVWAYQRVK